MTKIDIYSGFLGAGKTTLIKKLVAEAYTGQKIMIIENEFGEIGIDGGFLQDAGVQVREMNSGCICCSLTGDFKVALKMALEEYAPDRIVIEPSGVGKLSEVAAAVMATGDERLELGGLTTVVDASKCKLYLKNFGEFFKDQVGTAHTIVLSRTGKLSAEKVEEAVRLLRELNDKAQIVTADWDDLPGKDMLAIIDGRDALSEELAELIRQHVEEDAKWEAEDAEHEEHEHDDHDHEVAYDIREPHSTHVRKHVDDDDGSEQCCNNEQRNENFDAGKERLQNDITGITFKIVALVEERSYCAEKQGYELPHSPFQDENPERVEQTPDISHLLPVLK